MTGMPACMAFSATGVSAAPSKGSSTIASTLSLMKVSTWLIWVLTSLVPSATWSLTSPYLSAAALAAFEMPAIQPWSAAGAEKPMVTVLPVSSLELAALLPPPPPPELSGVLPVQAVMSTPTPTSAATAVVRRRDGRCLAADMFSPPDRSLAPPPGAATAVVGGGYGRCLAADLFSPGYRSLPPSPGGRGVVQPRGAHARRVVLTRAGQVVRSPAPPGRAPAGAPGVADPPPAAPAGPPGADTAPPPGSQRGPRGRFSRSARRICSRTAATMITPRATAWAELDRLFSVKTLPSVVKISTPRTVPTIVPRPPISRVPPMTTAAIASSSYRVPWVELPVVVRAMSITAAIPQVIPDRT